MRDGNFLTKFLVYRPPASFCSTRWNKSNPLKSFAVFSATAWNFSVKFHKFTWLSYLHFSAQWHWIISKYDEVIDILAGLLGDFRALKNGSCMWQVVPDHLQFFEFGDWFGFWMELVMIGLQNRGPDMVVHGSGTSWRQLIVSDEFWQLTWSHVRCVSVVDNFAERGTINL